MDWLIWLEIKKKIFDDDFLNLLLAEKMILNYVSCGRIGSSLAMPEESPGSAGDDAGQFPGTSCLEVTDSATEKIPPF